MDGGVHAGDVEEKQPIVITTYGVLHRFVVHLVRILENVYELGRARGVQEASILDNGS